MSGNNHHQQPSPEPVPAAFACPRCGERNMDNLVWVEDDCVECQSCGCAYDPSAGWTKEDPRDERV